MLGICFAALDCRGAAMGGGQLGNTMCLHPFLFHLHHAWRRRAATRLYHHEIHLSITLRFPFLRYVRFQHRKLCFRIFCLYTTNGLVAPSGSLYYLGTAFNFADTFCQYGESPLTLHDRCLVMQDSYLPVYQADRRKHCTCAHSWISYPGVAIVHREIY